MKHCWANIILLRCLSVHKCLCAIPLCPDEFEDAIGCILAPNVINGNTNERVAPGYNSWDVSNRVAKVFCTCTSASTYSQVNIPMAAACDIASMPCPRLGLLCVCHKSQLGSTVTVSHSGCLVEAVHGGCCVPNCVAIRVLLLH